MTDAQRIEALELELSTLRQQQAETQQERDALGKDYGNLLRQSISTPHQEQHDEQNKGDRPRGGNRDSSIDSSPPRPPTR